MRGLRLFDSIPRFSLLSLSFFFLVFCFFSLGPPPGGRFCFFFPVLFSLDLERVVVRSGVYHHHHDHHTTGFLWMG